MRQKVTILLPVYKPNLSFLEEQLDSISNQSFTDFSCIVSQDGPGNFGVIELLKSFDERFVFNLNLLNLGLYKHIEKLLENNLSKSDFVITCDQDDVWYSDRLEKQVSFLEKTSFSMATSNAFLSIKNEKTNLDLFKSLGISQDFSRHALLVNHATGAGSIYRSKDYLDSVPFPPNTEIGVHDHWMYIWGVSKGGCAFLTEPSWIYRQHSDNQIGVLGVVGILGKLKTALKKIRQILTGKLMNRDPFVIQLTSNLSVLHQRNENIKAQPNLTIRYTIKDLLSPRTLKASRLESLRIALNYSKLRSFSRF